MQKTCCVYSIVCQKLLITSQTYLYISPKNNICMSKKGISLPIEMIIIIAIAVLVLIVLAAFFIGGFGGAGSSINHQQAFGQGCSRLKFTHDCSLSIDTSDIKIPSYFAPGETTNPKSLDDACRALGYTDTSNPTCREACGCTN